MSRFRCITFPDPDTVDTTLYKPPTTQFFGVMTADGESKFSLPNGVC